jgi:type IX secretion system PorP/SprF family membrane protein
MPIKLLKTFHLAVLVIFFSTVLVAQDAPMSQYYSNLVVLNPAFVGNSELDRLNLFYRNQWMRSDAGFQSFGVAYDKSISEYNSGIGVVLCNEMNGAFIEPSIDLIYSYWVEAAPNLYISMALQVGIVQKYLNTSDLIFEDALADGSTDEDLKSGYSKTFPDFSTGLVTFYKNIYSGISIDHIAQPYQGTSKTSNERLNRKYTGFMGYMYYYDTRLKEQQRILSPNILVQIQGYQQNINWGISFQYDSFIGGLWLRHNLHPNFDALIFSLGFKTKSYKFAYSYDMNLGKKSLIPLGAHEISISTLFETQKKKKYKTIKCPTFLK